MSLIHLAPPHEYPEPMPLPFPETLTRAGLSGFPSPAQDYEGRTLDLNEHCVKRPAATFFLEVQGDSMVQFGIDDGDLLVVDRSIDARPGHVLVALVDGEIIVKRYDLIGKRPYLCSGNPRYAPIPLTDCECQVWGVVRSIVRELPV